MSNVYSKLQEARVILQEKKLKKSGKNKFAGFEYFELSDFLPTVNKIFNDLKLFSRFSLEIDIAKLTICNIEQPEEQIEFTTPTAELELKGCNAIQALGGVNTYCKRYLYLNALEIVESDLFDSTSGKTEKEVKKPVKETKTAADELFPQENPDLDILAGVNAVADLKNLEIYYKTNKDKVTDIKAFNKAVNKQKDLIQMKG